METSVYRFGIDTIDGEHLGLAVFRGLPLLIMNIGTQGPYADQIRELESLHESYGAMGLTVIGVPSNDFGGEPGEVERVRDRLRLDYRATFLTSRPLRVGRDRPAPLYRTLATFGDRPVSSDAEKFVIDGEGYVAERFGPEIRPKDPSIMACLKFVLPTLGY